MLIGLAALAAAATGDVPSRDAAFFEAQLAPQSTVALADGREIHFACMGEGETTAVFLGGFGDWGATWHALVPTVAKSARACTFDRPGFGLSGPDAEPQGTMHLVETLAATLDAAGIEGPVVLVGHSLGGGEALRFAERYPQRVSGLVLVDPSPPGLMDLVADNAPEAAAFMESVYREGMAGMARSCLAGLRDGKLVLETGSASPCAMGAGSFPPAVEEARLVRLRDPAAWETKIALIDSLFDGSVPAEMPKSLGDLPLVVLAAGREDPLPPDTPDGIEEQFAAVTPLVRQRLEEIAALSSQGEYRLVEDATHYIHRDRPDVVLAAIREVLAAAGE
ncbi:alpha/beta fold hydrolase [Sphingomicrobium nitratireducens]|uniref:alpha/beta fold hydrolase n=1 Tax=Sphingomicrobium nitratireducens TaxID=2964666 RepID=UPI00223EE542|nr:alpha/beta hydrolase [Sphingomicrobium nitratireducens]